MDGRAAWGARSNGLTPFDMAKLAGTDKDIQARLTATVTATHRAQEEVYVQTLQEVFPPSSTPCSPLVCLFGVGMLHVRLCW